MVLTRLQILIIRLLGPQLIYEEPTYIFLSGLIGQPNETFGAIRPHFGAKEPPTAEASYCLV